MKRQEKTPLTGGAQENRDSRGDDPLIGENGVSQRGIKARPQKSAPGSWRKSSRYVQSGTFRPSEQTLARRQREVLALLRDRGQRGVTKIDAPPQFSLSLAARISELRQKGYRIDTVPVRVGDARIARYVLIPIESVVPGADGDAVVRSAIDAEAGP